MYSETRAPVGGKLRYAGDIFPSTVDCYYLVDWHRNHLTMLCSAAQSTVNGLQYIIIIYRAIYGRDSHFCDREAIKLTWQKIFATLHL